MKFKLGDKVKLINIEKIADHSVIPHYKKYLNKIGTVSDISCHNFIKVKYNLYETMYLFYLRFVLCNDETIKCRKAK